MPSFIEDKYEILVLVIVVLVFLFEVSTLGYWLFFVQIEGDFGIAINKNAARFSLAAFLHILSDALFVQFVALFSQTLVTDIVIVFHQLVNHPVWPYFDDAVAHGLYELVVVRRH